MVATDVGGVPEALGALADGAPAGLLVPPDDAGALADALRALARREPELRGSRCARAALRRGAASLTGWDGDRRPASPGVLDGGGGMSRGATLGAGCALAGGVGDPASCWSGGSAPGRSSHGLRTVDADRARARRR